MERTGPAVVRVEARRRLPATGIVWSAAGAIVTAHHVVEQDDHVGIGLHDGRTLSACLLGRDPTTDVAVLQAQIGQGAAPPLTVPTWADPTDLRGTPGAGARASWSACPAHLRHHQRGGRAKAGVYGWAVKLTTICRAM